MKFTKKYRYIIAYFFKDQYALEKISEQGIIEAFSIDEFNFVNISNRNLWVVRGLIALQKN